MLHLRYFLPLLLLTACAPAAGVAPAPAGSGEIARLHQEQALLQSRLGELENRLNLLEARVDEQQAQLDRAQRGPESGTSGGQITEPSLSQAGRQAPDDTDAGGETSPTGLYLRAFSSYAAGRYAEAIDDFRQFLARYPRNAFVGNAQYWLGECYYRQHLLTRATQEFDKVSSLDPAGKKAPDALLRMVAIYRELNQEQLAEETLQKLLLNYPDSSAARKAGTR